MFLPLRIFITLCASLLCTQAFSATVLICSETGHHSGDSAADCAYKAWIDSVFLGDNALFVVCRGGHDCGFDDVGTLILKSSEFGEDDSVYFGGGWISPAELVWGVGGSVTGGGSSSSSGAGGGSNLGELPDLSWTQWGEIITAIGLMFVTIGVVRFIRKNV